MSRADRRIAAAATRATHPEFDTTNRQMRRACAISTLANRRTPIAPQAAPAAAAPGADDPIARLTRAKQMLDAGLITAADYDAVKAKALGL